MFWKPAEYPEFASLPKDEQMQILKLAMGLHARRFTFRLVAIVLMLFVVAVVLNVGVVRIGTAPFARWAIGPAFGLLFYAYLLWEINGPLRRAVLTYYLKAPDNDPGSRAS